MKNYKLFLPCLSLATIMGLACVTDDDPSTTGTDTDDPTTDPTTDPTGDPTGDPTTNTATDTANTDSNTATETSPTATDTMATDSGTDTDTDTGTTGPDPTEFIFREDDPGDYAQVDRMGFPAVNTALISSANKDTYNQSGPLDDEATNEFDDDIRASLVFLHVGTADDDNTGLNDDLAALELTPCDHTAGVGAIPECEQQVAPFIVPDVLRIDTEVAGGFPNGRMPSDIVMDPILAVVLLDLDAHAITTFVDIELNPIANDVELPTEFPYLAGAHE